MDTSEGWQPIPINIGHRQKNYDAIPTANNVRLGQAPTAQAFVL